MDDCAASSPDLSGAVRTDRRLLRLLTCGSVDDGKSTLIGRLLYDAGLIPDDVLAALRRDSLRHGTTGSEPDLALLVDGLEAERQQGITIDVAYRFFATARRSFIVADTPGHEQYTRNMATGASGAALALILVDARNGLTPQTKRHSFIASLLGIEHVVLAVNKMDLVGHAEPLFERIAAAYADFAGPLGFRSIQAMPLSARFGDNVVARSAAMPWYDGPTLLQYLEEVDVDPEASERPFRFPIQWVNRPDQDFRGLSGTVASGRIRAGEPVVIAGSGAEGRIDRIVTADGDLELAEEGAAVTLTLDSDVDAARGDILAPPDKRPTITDQFAAHLIWMDQEPLLPGRVYLLRIGHQWISATVTQIKHTIDVSTLSRNAARKLEFNEIGFCNLSLARAAPLDPYREIKGTGAFILVDRYTHRTVGAGMVAFSLRRAHNIHREHILVDKRARSELDLQKPLLLWFTGLSGSGKSTIAKLVERELHRAGRHTYVLDGDNLRHGLSRDLGFTEVDRVENIRRAGEVAKLFLDAGLIVIASFISPFRAERQMVREMVGPDEFVEIFVDTPLAECIRRDPKGLYRRAQAGLIQNFTGLDSPYEPPEAPELTLRTVGAEPEAMMREVLTLCRHRGINIGER